MDEQSEVKGATCKGISMKIDQSTAPFVELKIGDLYDSSLGEYLFHPDFIPDLIKALQVWELLDGMEGEPPYKIVFKEGSVIEIQL